jgi:hypothetical protein
MIRRPTTWALATFLTLFAIQAVAECKGECKKGELSVCVQQGNDCYCACAKDAGAGAQALQGILKGIGVSDAAISDSVSRYRGEMCKKMTGGAFSFELKDRGATLTVSGTRP